MTRVAIALIVLLAALVGLEVALVRDGHDFPGAFALAGLVGGVAIVGIAKLIGLVLQRPDTPS